MRLAILTPDLSAVETRAATSADVEKIYPGVQLGTVLTDASLADWPRLVLVREEARPTSDRWEEVVEGPDEFSAGAWRETWTRRPAMTLDEAKTWLAERAVDVWWEKWLARPTLAQVQNAGGDPQVAQDNRAAALRQALIDFNNQRMAATTFSELYALYEQLEAA